jgi:hypothetical protein
MTYTVAWTPAAQNLLATIWTNATDRVDVTAAANFIDAVLAQDPWNVGESRLGVSRVLIRPPLAVAYDVIDDDAKVIVWDVWRWQLPSP